MVVHKKKNLDELVAEEIVGEAVDALTQGIDLGPAGVVRLHSTVAHALDLHLVGEHIAPHQVESHVLPSATRPQIEECEQCRACACAVVHVSVVVCVITCCREDRERDQG